MILKWVGGKSRLLPLIKSNLPSDFENRSYLEPFLGGGSVFFGLKPKQSILGDLNSTLISVYSYVRDNPRFLIDLLKDHEINHFKNPNYYYTVRNLYNKELQLSVEKAAMFIYLNKTCFNGLYRVNSKGEFNTPKGSYVKPVILNTDHLLACSAAIQGTTLYCDSYKVTEHRLNNCERMFIYADPPYDGTFQGYQKEGFGSKDQEELYQWLLDFSNLGGKFMLSNSDTPYIRQLYSKFNIIKISLTRGMDRKQVSELLVKNYE
jgi:DNA adenine methylase